MQLNYTLFRRYMGTCRYLSIQQNLLSKFSPINVLLKKDFRCFWKFLIETMHKETTLEGLN